MPKLQSFSAFCDEWGTYFEAKTKKYRTGIYNKKFQVVEISTEVLVEAQYSEDKIKDIQARAISIGQSKAPYEYFEINGRKFLLAKTWRGTEAIWEKLGITFARSAKSASPKDVSDISQRVRGHQVSVAAVELVEHISSTERAKEIAISKGIPQDLFIELEKQQQKLLDTLPHTLDAELKAHIEKDYGVTGQYSFSLLMPELESDNAYKEEEQKLKKNAEKAFNNWISIVTEKHPELLIENITGSPTIFDAVDLILDDTIKGKKTKGIKFSHKHRVKPKQKSKKPKIVRVPTPRNRQGQFTSLISIQNLINSQIVQTVKENMGSPALNNKTGRFAESVTVDRLTMSRQGRITAFYTYMKYPYQTFERGYKQGSARRDPRTLISKSIREIATQAVSNRFDIRTRRI